MRGPRKPRKRLLYAAYLAVAGLLVAGGVAVRNARPSGATLRQQMIQAGHALVRESLQEGLRASFGGEEETTVEALPGNKFTISGWVDLVNQQGRVDRQNFSCVVFKNASDTWLGEKLSIIPQM